MDAPRGHGARRLRGLKALVHDAVDAVTDLVGEGHESTARTVRRVTDRVEPIAGPTRAIDAVRRVATRGVLGTVKLVNRAVEVVSDAGLDAFVAAPEGSEPAVPMRSDELARADIVIDAGLGLVNAAVGDLLDRKKNPLGLGLRLRIRDAYVDPSDGAAVRLAMEGALDGARTRRVAVFVHGLGTTEWSWVLEAHAYHGDPTATFGSLLERDLGIVPVFVRYNAGRHVSENGHALDAALRALVASTKLEEIVLVGHSMGGLVVRSACHYGAEGGAWVPLVRRVFSLGSPHQGAPLEKLGNVLTAVLGAIDLPGTLVPARILEARSAGIKDLRYGSLVDEDWIGRDPDALRDEGRREVPLLPGVAYYFVSATVTQDPEHPLGQLVGDLLVRVPSAHGPATSTSGTFSIETTRFGGVLHHQLQNHPAVYDVLRRACAEKP